MKPADEVFIDLGEPAGPPELTCPTCEELSYRMLSRWQHISVCLPVDLLAAVEAHASDMHGQDMSQALEDLLTRGIDHLRAELEERR